MDYLQRLNKQTKTRLFLSILVINLSLIAAWYLLDEIIKVQPLYTFLILLLLSLIEANIASVSLSKYLMQPAKALWQAVMHLVPESSNVASPDIDKLTVGKDFIKILTSQIYQLINVADKATLENKTQIKELSNNFIANNLPLPLIVLDPNETIKFANQALAEYIGVPINDLIGKNVYMVMDMSFPSEDTFDSWLKSAKSNSAKSLSSWERVKLSVRDNHPTLLFDLAAYYNRDNPDGNETMVVLFDHTKLYSQEDQAVSFMALSVHELRSPLTLLRGYIEVLKEELSSNVNGELNDFIDKMQAQADLLMAYVNNILNVARVDDDQLELRLVEEDWSSILKSAINSISLRAKVRGIVIRVKIQDDLPKVGADRLSVQEVINNLIDNAIKYSGDSKEVIVESHKTKDGLVETTVQDFGVGIPTPVMPNLFTKFYRDHHNRSQIGGTGLGLYLSNAIVKAHGGNIWVKSHVGQGSTFGFTLQPYANLNKDVKDSNDDGLVRNAHGWIKNHSLYRR